MEIREVIEYLKNYNGPQLKIMEVCGTHTAAIFKEGIRSLISDKINLISGPGCPVCVTPTAYIDKCIEYAMKDHHVLISFGDMLKVPGSEESLSEAKGKGAGNIELMYSPLEVIEKAKAHPDKTYVIAAVGFETTAPAYALMLKQAKAEGVRNISLVTALKTAIPALRWICENQQDIDGFICPGHVSVITGSQVYNELSEKYKKPFSVTGFEAEHILVSLYSIVRQIEKGECETRNHYKNAVKEEGNRKALDIIDEVFVKGPAMWRGLGVIENSGLYLSDEYSMYDAGSRNLFEDMKLPSGCSCAEVIVGKINPNQCQMFGKKCTPVKPFGPCMVSSEGACGIWFRNIN